MEEVKSMLIRLGKTPTGKVKTDKHISKMNGRKCYKCNKKIIYGDDCFTQTYSLKNTKQKFQASFHINCLPKL